MGGRTPEELKVIAKEFFAAMQSNDRDTLLRVLDPEGDWWTLARRGSIPVPEQLARYQRSWDEAANGLEFHVGTMMAEGERLGVDIRVFGDFDDGRRYDQYYYYIMEFKGDRIHRIWQYYDTVHSIATFPDRTH